jgi:hypothetical protein
LGNFFCPPKIEKLVDFKQEKYKIPKKFPKFVWKKEKKEEFF